MGNEEKNSKRGNLKIWEPEMIEEIINCTFQGVRFWRGIQFRKSSKYVISADISVVVAFSVVFIWKNKYIISEYNTICHYVYEDKSSPDGKLCLLYI